VKWLFLYTNIFYLHNHSFMARWRSDALEGRQLMAGPALAGVAGQSIFDNLAVGQTLRSANVFPG
jgi:hypothetical protein